MAQSASAPNIVNRGITRSIFRRIHLILSVPIFGYIYSPFDKIPSYAPGTRFVFVPGMILWVYGCGKVTSFDASFRGERPEKKLEISYARFWHFRFRHDPRF